MAAILEHDGKTPLKPGDVDGMEEFMPEADEPSSTDWDIAVENPPHAWWDGALPHPDLPPGNTAA